MRRPERIFRVGAVETYRVRIEKDNGFVFQKQLAQGVAQINSSVTCTRNSCSRGTETCDIVAKTHPRPEAVKQIKDLLRQGNQMKRETDDLKKLDFAVEYLIEEATSGDKDAINILQSSELSNLIGNAAAINENLATGLDTIDTLKNLHCLN